MQTPICDETREENVFSSGISQQSSVIGHRSSVIGDRSSVIIHQSSVIGDVTECDTPSRRRVGWRAWGRWRQCAQQAHRTASRPNETATLSPETPNHHHTHPDTRHTNIRGGKCCLADRLSGSISLHRASGLQHTLFRRWTVIALRVCCHCCIAVLFQLKKKRTSLLSTYHL